MTLVVRIKPRAQRQIENAAEWWAENRPTAPGAIRNDLKAALDALVEQPGIGTRVETTRAQEVRRLYLTRARYFVYYRVVATEKPNLWTATRMFALLNVSIYDAYINVFENKFFYNHWRPYTAIRWVEDDGNPRTEPDPQWTNPHKHTYPTASYPSAHASVSAAAMTILSKTFGDDYVFTMTTLEVTFDLGAPSSSHCSH